MSKKNAFARLAGVTAAAAGALALIAPGVASADAAKAPAPTVTAHVNGDAIEMTVTAPSAGQNLSCMPIIMSAADALPLAALPTDQWPGLGDLLPSVYYAGPNTTADLSTVEGTTALDEEDFNPGLLKPITPGTYAVVGACFDAEAQDAVLSYNYQVVFFPGGFGSLGQALDMGSATLKMDGGLGVIAGMLGNGAGSGLLTTNLS